MTVTLSFASHESRLADAIFLENYLQSTAAVFVALSIYENLVDPLVRHV